MHQALGQQADIAGIGIKGAVANDTACAIVQVQHRGETQVHPTGAQLGTQHIAAGGGGVGGTHRPFTGAAFAVLAPHLAQSAHRWQMGKTVGLKALHTPAFVVDADQQVLADFLDAAAQRGELGAVRKVAGKQNQAAYQRALETLFVGFGERVTGDVNDQGRVRVHG